MRQKHRRHLSGNRPSTPLCVWDVWIFVIIWVGFFSKKKGENVVYVRGRKQVWQPKQKNLKNNTLCHGCFAHMTLTPLKRTLKSTTARIKIHSLHNST